MILRRDGASRRKAAPEPPSTVATIGQSLAAARVRIGLSVDQAAANARASVPEIQALESGDLALFDDRVDALRTLRSYADSLGLDGDRHVVALLDCWSADDVVETVGAPSVTNGTSSNGAATGVVDATPVPIADEASDPVAGLPGDIADTASSDPTGADGGGPSTMLVPVVAAPAATTMTPATSTTSTDAPSPHTSEVALSPSWTPTAAPATAMTAATPRNRTSPPPVVAPVTGVVPVVGPGTPSPSGVASPAPAGFGLLTLRVLVAVLSVLIVLGLAGLVVHHWRPTWWVKLHLPNGRVVAAETASRTSPTTPTTAGPVVSVVSTTGTTETVKVRAAAYGIDVAAVGGASWMQATDAEHTSPVFSGVLQAGQSQLVSGSSKLTVEVGSSAGQVRLVVHQAAVATYKPHVAPYTYVFQLAD